MILLEESITQTCFWRELGDLKHLRQKIDTSIDLDLISSKQTIHCHRTTPNLLHLYITICDDDDDDDVCDFIKIKEKSIGWENN
jgi:hypothetical protein